MTVFKKREWTLTWYLATQKASPFIVWNQSYLYSLLKIKPNLQTLSVIHYIMTLIYLIKLTGCKIVIINILIASFFINWHIQIYFLCIYFYLSIPDILNTVPDDHNLLKLLPDIDHQWYVIGSALKVSYNVLSGLQTSWEKIKLNSLK